MDRWDNDGHELTAAEAMARNWSMIRWTALFVTAMIICVWLSNHHAELMAIITGQQR